MIQCLILFANGILTVNTSTFGIALFDSLWKFHVKEWVMSKKKENSITFLLLHQHANAHPRTFLSFSKAAFSFFSHFLEDLCICFDTIRRLIISSSRDTLFPIFVIYFCCVVCSGCGWSNWRLEFSKNCRYGKNQKDLLQCETMTTMTNDVVVLLCFESINLLE